MINKNLITVIVSIIGLIFQNPQRAQESLIQDVLKTLRGEISALLYRLLMGIVLASVIIFAGVKFLASFEIFASQFANAYILELLGFGSIMLIGSFLLFTLLNRKETRVGQEQVKLTSENVELDVLMLKFVEGVVSGMSNPSKAGENRSETKVPPSAKPIEVRDHRTDISNLQSPFAHPTRDFDF